MKIILTGSTGFIGKAVLEQCLNNPAITSIIALSRRELPANPKLTSVIMKDFKMYPEEVLEQLKSAEACIWSIGTYDGNPVVELEYPEAFQTALLKVLDGKKTFNYVYLGGAFTEEDQEKNLWLFSNGRRIRGLAQTKLLEFAKEHENVKPHVVRPGGVLGPNVSAFQPMLGCLLPTVSVQMLAMVMADLAVNGGSEHVVQNQAILDRGKGLLARKL